MSGITPAPLPSAPPQAPPINTLPVNTLSVVALVLAFVVPPGGIICGHLALGQIRRTGERGHGLALAGNVIGWILTVSIALVVVLVVLFSALAASEGYFTDPP